MNASAMLPTWVSGFSTPDPAVPAAELRAMDPSGLALLSGRTRDRARAIAAGTTQIVRSAAELSRGWSADGPRAGLVRTATAATSAGTVLLTQSNALERTSVVIERARAMAELDWTLALAELDEMQRRHSADLLGALVGAPLLAKEVEIAGIIRRLFQSLCGRIATVDSALVTLRAALARDPSSGPDGLRAGPTALLPPDPVNNPAHRTDQQNRANLAADLHSGVPARIKFAMSILGSLQQAADRGGTAQLVVYDARAYNGQGRAAIAVGDLTTATKVAVLVPGISNSPSAMDGGVSLAGDLRDEADRQDPAAGTAVVAWYGYDIPLSWPKDPESHIGTDALDTLTVGSAANAALGAPVLAADLQQLKALTPSADRTTLLGFSMGSTTVSETAGYDLPVDSIVLLGSPGAGWNARSADGYPSVPASEVYVLSYDQDPITLAVTDDLASRSLGFRDPYGPDPAAAAFGGQHIDATTNVPVLAGAGLIPALGRILGDPRHHAMRNYMQGTALAAEGAIVLGRRDRVPTKPGRGTR